MNSDCALPRLGPEYGPRMKQQSKLGDHIWCNEVLRDSKASVDGNVYLLLGQPLSLCQICNISHACEY